MTDLVSTVTARLQGHVDALQALGWHVEQPVPHLWTLQPPTPLLPLPEGKAVGLTVLAGVHGNETAGLGVLETFLRDLRDGVVVPRVRLAVGLGNPAALAVRLRYVDRDLNRSFDRDDAEQVEDARARALEPLLATSAFFLDLHQTSDPSLHPFFIFPYQRRNVAFARTVSPTWAIVTHFDEHYSATGRCADEYVATQGGTGITLELGQAGDDPYQVGVGAWAVGRAVRAVERTLLGEPAAPLPDTGPIYTWHTLVPYPGRAAQLRADLKNFSPVVQGERLGTHRGTPILAPASGRLLFPVRPIHLAHLPEDPTWLCRLVGEVDDHDLP